MSNAKFFSYTHFYDQLSLQENLAVWAYLSRLYLTQNKPYNHIIILL